MDDAKAVMIREKIESWIKAHLWLLAIIMGALIFFAFCGPLLTSHGATATLVGEGDDAYYEFAEAGKRANLYLSDLFTGSVWCWPLLLSYLGVIVAIIFTAVGKKWNDGYTVALLLYICLGIIFFTSNNLYDFTACSSLIGVEATGDWGYISSYSSYAGTKLAFGAVWSGIICFVSAFFCLAASNEKDSFSVRDLTEIGVLSAMAIGLQFIRIPVAAGPGSINLGLIPLFVIALRHGPSKSFMAGAFIYGLVTCLTDGYGFFTYPLDYLVGFGGVCALGFFRNLIFTKDEKGWNVAGFFYIALGVIIASLIRYIGSTASSMVNYGYSFQAALIYNAIYIPVTGAVSLGAMLLLYIPLAKLEKIFPPKEVVVSTKNA